MRRSPLAIVQVLLFSTGATAVYAGGCEAVKEALPASFAGASRPIDGEYSSDDPPARLPDGGAACTADYVPGGRNPGLVRITSSDTFSFFADRQGERSLAEACRYASRGSRPDPRWFGTKPGQSPTSIWMLYELASGPPSCEQRFHFVAVRPPEGEGPRRHMHLRYGDRTSSLDKLVALSAADSSSRAGASSPCDPWWSVYCANGYTGCDPD
jgi:hypothetical protein